MDFFQFLALKLTDLFTKNQVHPSCSPKVHPLGAGRWSKFFCQSVLINKKIISTKKIGPPSRP